MPPKETALLLRVMQKSETPANKGLACKASAVIQAGLCVRKSVGQAIDTSAMPSAPALSVHAVPGQPPTERCILQHKVRQFRSKAKHSGEWSTHAAQTFCALGKRSAHRSARERTRPLSGVSWLIVRTSEKAMPCSYTVQLLFHAPPGSTLANSTFCPHGTFCHSTNIGGGGGGGK